MHHIKRIMRQMTNVKNSFDNYIDSANTAKYDGNTHCYNTYVKLAEDEITEYQTLNTLVEHHIRFMKNAGHDTTTHSHIAKFFEDDVKDNVKYMKSVIASIKS